MTKRHDTNLRELYESAARKKIINYELKHCLLYYFNI